MTALARTVFFASCSALLFASCALATDKPTIVELMVLDVTPATDTLWGADDPQTDDEWQLLDDAADATIKAFQRAKKGGAGPNDNAWAR
jgi:hypothetical protein